MTSQPTLHGDRPSPPPGHAAAPDGRRWRSVLTGRRVFITLTMAVLVYLVIGPFAVLVMGSFQDTSLGIRIRPPITWTMGNYVTATSGSALYRTLLNTAVFTVISLSIAMIVAFFLAFLIERTNVPSKTALFILVVAPSGIPAVILAVAWTIILNPRNGVVNVILRSLFGIDAKSGPIDVYTLPVMAIVQGMALVPLTFLLIVSSLRGMSTSLEDAGRSSGANNVTIFRTITLPVLKPAMLGALLFQLVTVISTLDIPLLLGRPGHVAVLSTAIYDASNPSVGLPNNGVASAYGVLLVVLSMIPLIFYNRVIRESDSFVTVTGKSRAPRLVNLGKWRYPLTAACYLYILFAFLLPLFVLVWASLQPYVGALDLESLKRLTVTAYENLISDRIVHLALWNTFVLGVCSAIAAIAISTAVSWIIVRVRSRFSTLVDALAFLPHAFPGVVIGLATLFLYLVIPLPIYGTIWIVVLAMATQFIGLGTRLTTAAITQIQVTLEHAASASGSSGWQTTRRVLIPLLRPALFNGLLVVFLSSVQNLTLPLMLGSGDNVVMASLIYRRWFDGNAPSTAALGVVLTALTLIMTLLMRRSSMRDATPPQ